MEDRPDDAEAAEDLARETDPGAPEVPEADALEQAAELDADDEERRSVGDAPEADALEQSRGVPGDADDDEHR